MIWDKIFIINFYFDAIIMSFTQPRLEEESYKWFSFITKDIKIKLFWCIISKSKIKKYKRKWEYNLAVHELKRVGNRWNTWYNFIQFAARIPLSIEPLIWHQGSKSIKKKCTITDSQKRLFYPRNNMTIQDLTFNR